MKHNHCVACGIREQLHQHHLVPKSRGGGNDETNLITLCVDCHEKIHGVNNSLIKLSTVTRENNRRNGKALACHPPYGKMKTPDGYLVDNPIEQTIIERICELKVSLCCGSETIINELEQLGYKTRKGGKFQASSILRILKSKGLQQNGYIRFNPKKPQDFQSVMAKQKNYTGNKRVIPTSLAYDKRQQQAKSTKTIGQTYEIF